MSNEVGPSCSKMFRKFYFKDGGEYLDRSRKSKEADMNQAVTAAEVGPSYSPDQLLSCFLDSSIRTKRP